MNCLNELFKWIVLAKKPTEQPLFPKSRTQMRRDDHSLTPQKIIFVLTRRPRQESKLDPRRPDPGPASTLHTQPSPRKPKLPAPRLDPNPKSSLEITPKPQNPHFMQNAKITKNFAEIVARNSRNFEKIVLSSDAISMITQFEGWNQWSVLVKSRKKTFELLNFWTFELSTFPPKNCFFSHFQTEKNETIIRF